MNKTCSSLVDRQKTKKKTQMKQKGMLFKTECKQGNKNHCLQIKVEYTCETLICGLGLL